MTHYSSADLKPADSRLRVRRTRGAFSGFLLLVLGAWGALSPFIGPYFDFGFRPDETWQWSMPKFWFEVLPGGVTALAGIMLLLAADRVTLSIGSWLAVAAGAWFVVGQQLSQLVDLGSLGGPIRSGETAAALQNLLMLTGIGVVIVFLGAVVLGRASILGVADVRRGRARREAAADPADYPTAATANTAPDYSGGATERLPSTESRTTDLPPTDGPGGTDGRGATGGIGGTRELPRTD